MTGFDDKDSLKSSIERDVHERIANRVGRRNRRDCGTSSGLIWGAVICAIGAVLLLDHLGVVSADRLWRFWPTVLVIVGAVSLAQAGNRVWGICLVVVGLLLQLDALQIIHFRRADLWPLAIIAAGLMMIWGSIESRRIRAATAGGNPNTTNISAVFGGIERRVSARDFRGGTVSAVFGGAELDFRDADMEGDQVVLEVNAVFGGAEIRVPENWRVEVRGQTFFGGYSDKTRDSATPNLSTQKRKTLVLTGTTLFGGVEVKN
jgi:predicted membrane protein